MNKLLEEYYSARKRHDVIQGTLDAKVGKIVKIIASCFKLKDYWWAYDYYEDADDPAPLPQKLEDDGQNFPIHISEECDSGNYYYNEALPCIFFDMTEEEIREYIKNDIEQAKTKEKEEEEQKQKKLLKNKEKKESLLKSAVSKLTDQERKALNL